MEYQSCSFFKHIIELQAKMGQKQLWTKPLFFKISSQLEKPIWHILKDQNLIFRRFSKKEPMCLLRVLKIYNSAQLRWSDCIKWHCFLMHHFFKYPAKLKYQFGKIKNLFFRRYLETKWLSVSTQSIGDLQQYAVKMIRLHEMALHFDASLFLKWVLFKLQVKC